MAYLSFLSPQFSSETISDLLLLKSRLLSWFSKRVFSFIERRLLQKAAGVNVSESVSEPSDTERMISALPYAFCKGVKVIDDNNETNIIRCWGIDPARDRIHINRPYIAKLKHDPNWGFSTFSIRRNFKLLG